jgi:hypothetical protein
VQSVEGKNRVQRLTFIVYRGNVGSKLKVQSSEEKAVKDFGFRVLGFGFLVLIFSWLLDSGFCLLNFKSQTSYFKLRTRVKHD